MVEVTVAAKGVFGELMNLCVLVKDNGGMGTFYRSRHEFVFAFNKGAAPHINNFELGQHGRYRTNVWQYKGVNTLRAGRLDDLSLHPTVKPVAMIADAIKDVSKRNGIVLDPFGGSGSTLIAAHKTGRRGFLAELDLIYVDCIIRRWQVYAKHDAILVSSGETFDAVSQRRKVESARISASPERKIGASQIVGRSDAVRKRRTHPQMASSSAVQQSLVIPIPATPPSLLLPKGSRMDDSHRKNNSSIGFEQETASYEVGYRKPPTATRFRKGQSGNPCGRPKGAKNKLPAMNEEGMKSILIEEAYRVIKVRDGSVTIPMIRAGVRSMPLRAAKGHARSQRMFTSLLQATEKEQKALHDEWLKSASTRQTRKKRWSDATAKDLPDPNRFPIQMTSLSTSLQAR